MTAMQPPDPVTARLTAVAVPEAITQHQRDASELVVVVDPRGHVEWASPLDRAGVVDLLERIAAAIRTRAL